MVEISILCLVFTHERRRSVKSCIQPMKLRSRRLLPYLRFVGMVLRDTVYAFCFTYVTLSTAPIKGQSAFPGLSCAFGRAAVDSPKRPASRSAGGAQTGIDRGDLALKPETHTPTNSWSVYDPRSRGRPPHLMLLRVRVGRRREISIPKGSLVASRFVTVSL